MLLFFSNKQLTIQVIQTNNQTNEKLMSHKSSCFCFLLSMPLSSFETDEHDTSSVYILEAKFIVTRWRTRESMERPFLG